MIVVEYLYPRKTKDGRSRNFAFVGFRMPGGVSAHKLSRFVSNVRYKPVHLSSIHQLCGQFESTWHRTTEKGQLKISWKYAVTS